MIIKKFVARSMNEALAQVKSELGEDAVILQSRKVEKSGVLGVGSSGGVEVTAATPDRNPPPGRPRPGLEDDSRQTLRRSLGGEQEKRPLGTRSTPRDSGSDLASPQSLERLARRRASERERAPRARDFADLEQPRPRRPQEGPSRNRAEERDSRGDSEQVRQQLDDLKRTVDQLAAHVKKTQVPQLPTALAGLWEHLVVNGLSEGLATELVEGIVGVAEGRESSEEELESLLHDSIASRFRVDPLDDGILRPGGPTVIYLVGPTGVGKTTTLAKLATNRTIFGRKRIGLISTDTYRVAAVEQLRTFASIAGLPLDVVYRPEELPRAIDRRSEMDVILVDTAGRSQNDREAIEELNRFVEEGRPDDVLLVLSANARLQDQAEAVEKFGEVDPTRVVVTKLDEVSQGGHLLELAGLLDRPWCSLTTGQDVPDDIVEADSLLLAAMVARKEYFQQLRDNQFQLPPLDQR